MKNGRSSKVITKSKPETGWREPLRAADSMLRIPKGRPLRPIEELHEMTPPITASSAGINNKVAVQEEAFTRETRDEDAINTISNKAVYKSSQLSVEAQIVTLDGTTDSIVVHDGDAKAGSNASKLPSSAHVFSADAGKLAHTLDVNAGGEVAEDELLAGEERGFEDEERDEAGTDVAHSTQTCTHQARTLREGTETIRPHATDASKVIVTYRFTDDAGNVYVQKTELPQVVSTLTNASGKSGSILCPDVETSKVPRKRKDSPWVPVPGTSRHEWTRNIDDKQETWRVAIFFRRLDRDTHAYQDIYINTNMLSNVDPNDKAFKTSYNKWVLQFARRRDATYTQKVARVHWSVAERRVLYTGINSFCAKFGIHRFGFTEDCKLSTRQLQLMADAVNAASNPLRTTPRGVDAVRGQIISAHNKTQPKNKEIFDLLGTAMALRARLATGEVISRAERKPRAAIAPSEFPVEPPVAAVESLKPGGRKRKRGAVVKDSDGEPTSSELSSPPGSEVGGDKDVGEDTWMTTDEEIWQGESEEGSWSDTNEEVGSGEDGDEWAVVEEVASSPPAKKARNSWT